jgi:hypothetical protein
MAQSIQVLSDRTVAVDMKYPHLVEAVRNGEIDLDLYTRAIDLRKHTIEVDEIFPTEIEQDNLTTDISQEIGYSVMLITIYIAVLSLAMFLFSFI